MQDHQSPTNKNEASIINELGFTIPFPIFVSLEECGVPKCFQRLTSLCGQWRWVEFWPMTIWQSLIVIYWCCMCKRAGENTNYLLLHCPLARELWSMVSTFFGVFWVMPKDVVELLASWPGKFSKHRNGVIWNTVPHCLIWSIWRERNTQIFEGTNDQFKTWRLPSSRLCLGGQMCQVFYLSILCLICLIDVVFILLWCRVFGERGILGSLKELKGRFKTWRLFFFLIGKFKTWRLPSSRLFWVDKCIGCSLFQFFVLFAQ